MKNSKKTGILAWQLKVRFTAAMLVPAKQSFRSTRLVDSKQVYAIGALLRNLGYLASISYNFHVSCEESNELLTAVRCLQLRPYLVLMPSGDQLLTFTIMSVVVNCFHSVALSKHGNGLSKSAIHSCIAFSSSCAAAMTVAFVIAIAQRDEALMHVCCWVAEVTPKWFLRFYFILCCVVGSCNALLLIAAAVWLKFKAAPNNEHIRRIYQKRVAKVLQQTLLMGFYSVIFQAIPATGGMLVSTYPRLIPMINALWTAVPIGNMLVVLQRLFIDKELRAVLSKMLKRSKTAPSPLYYTAATER
ncbi:hypothetical protein TTRE_0000746401 [Trichuris trichiura]|uniref:G-protein coupled receptors family 1 profile domain-containing protein n=1 Tax=Trichuris trichiura TaxID=36087 RepID=A0A077ZH57_TRITR|nr:hypothetical protein TTRE_0000746401 [Trichuris trichiura]